MWACFNSSFFFHLSIKQSLPLPRLLCFIPWSSLTQQKSIHILFPLFSELKWLTQWSLSGKSWLAGLYSLRGWWKSVWQQTMRPHLLNHKGLHKEPFLTNWLQKELHSQHLCFSVKSCVVFFWKNIAVLQKQSGPNKGAIQVLTPGDPCIVSWKLSGSCKNLQCLKAKWSCSSYSGSRKRAKY